MAILCKQGISFEDWIKYRDWMEYWDNLDGYSQPKTDSTRLMIHMDLYRKLDIYLRLGDRVKRMSFILDDKEINEIERLALKRRDLRIKEFRENLRELVDELYGGGSP